MWRPATAGVLILAFLGSFCLWIAECTDSRPPIDCSPFLELASDALPNARNRTNDTRYRHWEPVLMRCFAAHKYNKRFYPLNPKYKHDSEVLQLKYGAHLIELTSFGVRTSLNCTRYSYILAYLYLTSVCSVLVYSLLSTVYSYPSNQRVVQYSYTYVIYYNGHICVGIGVSVFIGNAGQSAACSEHGFPI